LPQKWKESLIVHIYEKVFKSDCADDVNIFGTIIQENAIKTSTETLLVAIKEVEQYLRAEKTKYKVMSCHQNAGQIRKML
jgi:hypothetical protein